MPRALVSGHNKRGGGRGGGGRSGGGAISGVMKRRGVLSKGSEAPADAADAAFLGAFNQGPQWMALLLPLLISRVNGPLALYTVAYLSLAFIDYPSGRYAARISIRHTPISRPHSGLISASFRSLSHKFIFVIFFL